MDDDGLCGRTSLLGAVRGTSDGSDGGGGGGGGLGDGGFGGGGGGGFGFGGAGCCCCHGTGVTLELLNMVTTISRQRLGASKPRLLLTTRTFRASTRVCAQASSSHPGPTLLSAVGSFLPCCGLTWHIGLRLEDRLVPTSDWVSQVRSGGLGTLPTEC
jgi:hypothetical protein